MYNKDVYSTSTKQVLHKSTLGYIPSYSAMKTDEILIIHLN